jgi:septal ring factor EnvC (AmiA/AmiB activator)
VSRSVLYKPHILKIWNEPLWRKRYGNKNEQNKYFEKELRKLHDEKDHVEQILRKAEAKIKKLNEQLEEESVLTKGQRVTIKRLEEENSVLLGHIEILNGQLNARGLIYVAIGKLLII